MDALWIGIGAGLAVALFACEKKVKKCACELTAAGGGNGAAGARATAGGGAGGAGGGTPCCDPCAISKGPAASSGQLSFNRFQLRANVASRTTQGPLFNAIGQVINPFSGNI